jgi:pimeloyl-ACP methyl ester carboxylesterase
VEIRLVDGVAVREWGAPGDPGVLLWPGLGSTGAYFSAVGTLLPGRAVAVDPPGFGGSPAPEAYRYEALVELAAGLADDCGCRAIVGHSLGADIALGVACRPPAGLRAAVLVDGGYLDAGARAQLGLPTGAGHDELSAWWRENGPRFPDWETAMLELAVLFDTEVTPALEVAVRDSFASVEGEIRGSAPAERVADLLLAVVHQDVADRARRLAVPTLLVACGRPPEGRAVKEPAWRAFAAASPMVDLHVADDWGHNPLLQDPAGSARLIAEWLRGRM